MSSTTALKFQRRPAPVLPEHRPMYLLCVLALVLHLSSRGAKSSIERLHLLVWGLKSQKRSFWLVSAASKGALAVQTWSFDPALESALAFASAESLIDWDGKSYRLTDKGELLAKRLIEQPELLASEKEVLVTIGKRVTESMVAEITKGWGER